MGITEWTVLVILHFILLGILQEGLSLLVVKNLPAIRETQVRSLGLEDPLLEKGMATHSTTLAYKFHGQRSLVGYSP